MKSFSEYLNIPGILLHYIGGFPLTDIADYAPRESWQTICEDAIRIINLIGDLGILNEDVKTRSFIAHEDMDAENEFKVTMTDFALCKFRREYEDDYAWDTWKAMQDEEGAVGYVMQRHLQGGSVYHRSDRYEKLDIEFKMDDRVETPAGISGTRNQLFSLWEALYETLEAIRSGVKYDA